MTDDKMPKPVFSHGPWLLEETGQRFTGDQLDAAAFAKYRAALAAQAEKHAVVVNKCNSYIVDNARLAEANDALRAEVEALRAALKPFADADLTLPTVRDTFGFDVLRARAALAQPAEPAALTDAEIDAIPFTGWGFSGERDVFREFARAIERTIVLRARAALAQPSTERKPLHGYELAKVVADAGAPELNSISASAVLSLIRAIERAHKIT